MSGIFSGWHAAEISGPGVGLGRWPRFLPLTLWLAAGWSGATLAAQDQGSDQGIPTLHVYTNLVQIPTLVLTANRDPVTKPIDPSRFSVSIDSGPWFRATHVRQEGEDPILLSILLDLSGDTAQLAPKMGAAFASLAPLSLHPKDRVSIYALSCGLFRSIDDAPADIEALKKGVDAAVQPWMQRKGDKHAKSCEQEVPLWDGLAEVAARMMDSPGRRVILAVSDGQDKGSKHSWSEVTDFAQASGIAVFGISHDAEPVMGSPMVPSRRGGGVYIQGGTIQAGSTASAGDTHFISLCEMSGGIVTRTDDRRSLQEILRGFVQMVRQRYIVEFPRPSNSTPGQHGMDIKIAKGSYLIRAAGVSMPVPDAALMADPTTVPSDPSRTPEQGSRKPATKPR